MSSNSQVDVAPVEEIESTEQTQKSFEYRKGIKYQTMFADNRVLHESDVNLLPEGATVIKSVYESTYEQERQGAKTAKIMQQLRQRLEKLLADTSGMRGELMQGALTYLNKFWDQFFLYLKDGRYCIDNSLAECMLRPMTVERKNSLTFGSHAGVEVSVIYHTFIETCKMCGVSTLEYFKEFFTAIMQGRTDD